MADFVTQHCGVVDASKIVPWTCSLMDLHAIGGQESV